MRKRVLSLILILAMLLQLLLLGSCADTGTFTATDKNGNKLPQNQTAYLKLVEQDAAEIIAEKEGISVEKAKKQLNSNNYNVQTAFNPDVYAALEEAYQAEENAPTELGCAVIDNSGLVVAVFSASKEDKNNSTEKVKPYGTLAPLSIYAPAIDNETANYSSAYLDAPLLKIEGKEWPVNSTGNYTYKKTTLATAAGQGLPTVAVRCLKETGTDNSIAFLKKLGIELKPSAQNQEALLKSLTDGSEGTAISPLEMAGYYNIFANNGYYGTTTVMQITDQEGNFIYEGQPKVEQVMTPSSAYIVNRLLTGAVTKGGVAEAAALEEDKNADNATVVAGTASSGTEGHWFVGMTTEYSCAVWHGADTAENHAPAFFSKALSKFSDKAGDFTGDPEVFSSIFCKESGLLASKGCSKMQMGYYTVTSRPAVCEEHK